MPRPLIPFYFGVGSRYSYLAATQLEAVEARAGCRFEWIPLSSPQLIRRANGGNSPFGTTGVSGQYDWDFRRKDAEAWARYYAIPYTEPEQPGLETSDHAHACWIAGENGKLKDMCWQIMNAKFNQPRDLSRDGLAVLADEIGLNAADLIAKLDDPDVAAKHEAALARALDDGVFGVPSFMVMGELYWGNDRLPLVEHALGPQN